jgi:hypothetical protein
LQVTLLLYLLVIFLWQVAVVVVSALTVVALVVVLGVCSLEQPLLTPLLQFQLL